MATSRVTRFDHAVIAVKDLDSAMASYRELGFDVSAGGRHTGRGTHNAIIRFGLDYLELISVHDERLARAAGGNVMDLLHYLEHSAGGPLGFALAATGLDEIARSWSSRFAPAGSPVAMERVRPDGMRLQWHLLIPGGSAWRKPWPFLIEWGTPDAERLGRDAGGPHRNLAATVAGVSVVAAELGEVRDVYSKDLRLSKEPSPMSKAATRFTLGSTTIDLLAASTEAQRSALERDGPGLFEIVLGVSDVAAASHVVGVEPDRDGRIAIPPDRACGARIALIERR